MTRMIVGVREVWIRRVAVDVEGGEEEAIRLVEAGNGQRLGVEYAHTLPAEAWSAEEDAEDAEARSRPSQPAKKRGASQKKGRPK